MDKIDDRVKGLWKLMEKGPLKKRIWNIGPHAYKKIAPQINFKNKNEKFC